MGIIKIKNFKDACEAVAAQYPFVRSHDDWMKLENFSPARKDQHMIAFLKLRVICAALNNGWSPKFIKSELRWFPVFKLYIQEEWDAIGVDTTELIMDIKDYAIGYRGFGVVGANCCDLTPIFSPCLLFKTHELAEYCGRQFIDLWADLYLPMKKEKISINYDS